MLEIKITIAAPDLAVAINNLAAALSDKAPHFVCTQNGGNNHQIENVGTLTMNIGSKTQPTAPAAPVNPMQATGAPLSATPAQTMAPVANVPVASAVPTGAPTYTLDMIARAGAALVDAGKMDALCGLLAKYGVEALTALDPAQYGNFANELRALGATI